MIKVSPIFHIGIIGCGKMGRDLFDWLTGFPFAVTWVCRTAEQTEQFEEVFVKKQRRAIKYGLGDENTTRFRTVNTIITSDMEKLTHCDLVLETITEDIECKRTLFHKLQQILPETCVIASNTSSIPPDTLFKGLSNQKNCVGLHFFFPVALKNFVEINTAENTSKQAISTVENFLNRTERFYLKLSGNDQFIINRLFLKMQAGCCRLIQEDLMDIREIDVLVKENLFPVGIFEFFDYVGNDVMLQSVRNYLAYEKDSGFYLPMIKILEQKVKEGKLGKKTKTGFYDYPVKKIPSKDPGVSTKREKILQQIIYWYLDGVFDVLQRKICSRKELEFLVKEYMAVEQSPFDLAMENGYKS